MKKITQEKWLERAIELHGEEFEFEQWKPLKYPGIYKPVCPRFDDKEERDKV